MQLATFRHDMDSGWDHEGFPELDSSQTAVFVFGAPEYRDDPTALRELREAYPQSHMIGCSTAGEIFQDSVSDRTLSVAVARFEHTRLCRRQSRVAGGDESFDAGQWLARSLHGPGLRGVFVLSDGLNVNGSELVRGLNSVLPEGVVVTGGLAGDGDRFESTWIAGFDGETVSGHVTALALYGDRVSLGHGSRGGWDKFGPERVVTRSEGNVLYELDGKPALRLYREYLGDRADGLPATGLLFPLAIRCDDDPDKPLVRTILAIDDDAQSLTFAGDIPEGARAQLMMANFDRLVGGAEDAAKMVDHGAIGEDILALAISCVGRRLVLGERTEEEVEASLSVLPPQTRQVGFYSYGEIGPYSTGKSDLHNQTMTLTTVCEH